MLCVACRRFIHKRVHIKPRIIRDHIAARRALAFFKRAHNVHLSTHGNQHDFRFRAPVAADRFRRAHPNLVPVHRAVHGICGNEQVIAAILRDEEAVAPRVALYTPVGKPRLLRERKLPFARQDQPALRKQLLDGGCSRIALLCREFFQNHFRRKRFSLAAKRFHYSVFHFVFCRFLSPSFFSSGGTSSFHAFQRKKVCRTCSTPKGRFGQLSR